MATPNENAETRLRFYQWAQRIPNGVDKVVMLINNLGQYVAGLFVDFVSV